MFDLPIKFLPKERVRYTSALTNMHLNHKVYRKFGKLNLKEYIENFKLSLKLK